MPIDQSALRRELNPAGRPLNLTPEFRQRLEGNQRLRLQPPDGSKPDFDRRISGLPGDVLLALESLRALADQGNRIAARLYVHECKRLGLWYEKTTIWLPHGRV